MEADTPLATLMASAPVPVPGVAAVYAAGVEWTDEEDRKIVELVQKWGTKWAAIANELSHRSSPKSMGATQLLLLLLRRRRLRALSRLESALSRLSLLPTVRPLLSWSQRLR